MKEQKDNNTQKRAYLFALNIINHCKKLPSDITTQIIVKQLIRCATSVGTNIIEAQAASSRKDFANFFNHALKSANETKFWLYLLRDTLKDSKVNDLIDEVNQLSNILGKSLITLRNK